MTGASLVPSTWTTTVDRTPASDGSLTSTEKLSVPAKSSFGVYVNFPLGSRITSPFDGRSWTLKDRMSPSMSSAIIAPEAIASSGIEAEISSAIGASFTGITLTTMAPSVSKPFEASAV